MLTTLIITLFLGITLGLLLIFSILFYLLKVKCPKCKKLKPLKEIIFFHWKTRSLTVQSCPRCQWPKTQINITL